MVAQIVTFLFKKGTPSIKVVEFIGKIKIITNNNK